MLKITNLSKMFGDISILDQIDLEIKKASIVGLAGPSGSGKSTLLRLIQKLEIPDSGTIQCNARTGFMFQDFQLFPHMTVLENITYAPKLHKKDHHYLQRANTILENLGITSKAHEYPKNLSGGEKQRAALARSLMMHPDILLCDEPTSGLDIATTSDVVSLLESVRNMGVTMLIASHDLDFLIKISDRIILLKKGKIAVDINPKIINDPIKYLKNYY
jgi:polar amino acid transport system ATP-binding protein